MTPLQSSDKKQFIFEIEEVRFGTLIREYPSDTTDEQAIEWMKEDIMYKNAANYLPDARIETIEIITNTQ